MVESVVFGACLAVTLAHGERYESDVVQMSDESEFEVDSGSSSSSDESEFAAQASDSDDVPPPSRARRAGAPRMRGDTVWFARSDAVQSRGLARRDNGCPRRSFGRSNRPSGARSSPAALLAPAILPAAAVRCTRCHCSTNGVVLFWRA